MNDQVRFQVPPSEVVTVRGSQGVGLVTEIWRPAGGLGRRVILGHGGGQTRHAWDATAPRLARLGYEVWAFDLRGHGDSDWSADGDYSANGYLTDAEALHAASPLPTTWVGASLSGLLGLLMAGERRLPLQGLCLVDIAPMADMSGVAKIIGFMTEHVDEGFATVEEAADVIAAYLPHRPRPKDLSGLAKNLRRRPDGRWRWHWDPRFLSTGRWADEGPHQDRLGSAARGLCAAANGGTVPTLLVRGKRSELVPPEAVETFRGYTPHLAFVDVAEAGHMVAGDSNDVFSAALGGWLAKL
jgi:pimeloyl-ACP methyl ester carboxylesterase